MRVLSGFSVFLIAITGFAPQIVFSAPVEFVRLNFEWKNAPKVVEMILLDLAEKQTKSNLKGLKSVFLQADKKTKVISNLYLQKEQDRIGPHILDPFLDEVADSLGEVEYAAPPVAQRWFLEFTLRVNPLLVLLDELEKEDIIKIGRVLETLEGAEAVTFDEVQKGQERQIEIGSKWKLPKTNRWDNWFLKYIERHFKIEDSLKNLTPEQKSLPFHLFLSSEISRGKEFSLLLGGFVAQVQGGEEFKLLTQMLDSIETHDRLILIFMKSSGPSFLDPDLIQEVLGKEGKKFKKPFSFSGKPETLQRVLAGELLQ